MLLVSLLYLCSFFFFKQKTAYEMRISDWSSDVCSSDLRIFTTEAGEALLPAAERAGLKPAYGCRIGVCRTCLCHKRSGTVENLVTGERSSGADEWIRLCVSTPRSDQIGRAHV